MLSFVRIVVLVTCFLTVAHSFDFPRNADQTLWALNTCIKESKASSKTADLWKDLNFEKSEETYCFVQCLWTYLGVYDEKTKIFNADAVKIQFQKRGVSIPKGLDKLKVITRGTCKDIFDLTKDFLKANKKELKFIFYWTPETQKDWFDKNKGKVKNVNQKASDFCKNEEDLCRLNCRFYYYRLVDEDLRVVFFTKPRINGISDAQINKCRLEANQTTGCAVAKVLKQCLDKIDAEKVEKALQMWDETSKTYA
ncbi:uncharacterized protein LOC132255566 [Phlebotomus argentipes]|uniref:uncharacterized protein LOC132255566 n=1 Tax=Phlebotomus argentipes TaxID=94469 RepID=UPI002892A2DA|nr:uncharacterized protein LOC132255566 [Phlebotomus argentipes]